MVYGNGYAQPQGYGQQYAPGQQAVPQAKLSTLGQLMNGGGAKAFFNTDSPIGAMVEGEVVSIEVSQVKDFQTKQPAFFQSGGPKQQIHIVLQTSLPPEDEDDDSRRSLWIKGWGVQVKALREACKKAGVKEPSIGDHMSMKYVGFGERGNAPQPPKVYEFTVKPASQAAVGDLLNTGEPAPAVPTTPAPVATPTPAPVTPATPAAAIPATAVSQPNVNDIKALLNIGKSEEEVAALMNTSVAVVHALAGAPQTPAVEQDSIAF
ncbi:hypothetical protein [Alloscardovia sp. HMSC034E08]|uniref:hypothetical protein n=1 Tax=Alloscardovia sp. HMSC034E08 TaxID=1739413 RepID=UPI0008BC7BFD|nr:hypothetical protein [Alloscardovia sp. HMSC034E08]OFQ97012.1 hypothetical protein HMPREF2909_00195 [Alloscardovia sp. HMSC034E08]